LVGGGGIYVGVGSVRVWSDRSSRQPMPGLRGGGGVEGGLVGGGEEGVYVVKNMSMYLSPSALQVVCVSPWGDKPQHRTEEGKAIVRIHMGYVTVYTNMWCR
jgi:hypothetical protein